MTTIPGTYFTEEQLEADLKDDKVYPWGLTGAFRMKFVGVAYENDKQQYDKALAWYLLAARKNDSIAQNNIGALYYYGQGVPKNYLCALKWYLKSVEGNNIGINAPNIGNLFEYGYGVPVDKYKALEWYCHGGNKAFRNRLKAEGYHRSGENKKKPIQQLIKETEATLDAEKKNLEEKKEKTQEEVEALEQLKIAYKLTGGGVDAWKDVPILLAGIKQQGVKPVNTSTIDNEDEASAQKKQSQLLEQKEKEMQALSNQHQSLKQEKSILQLRIKELDRQLSLLESEKATFEHQLETKNKTISSLESENQSLKLERSDLDQQIKTKENKINLLENEKRQYHTTSMQQTQLLDTLKQEKQIIEQSKMGTTNEMKRLKSSYSTLEQLLKSKEDTIMSLNRENQMLSTVNQGNQQGTNDMVDTLKSLLQAKNSEIELNKLTTEHALDKEKGKIKKLQKEIERLKQNQHQQTREASSSNNATVPESTISNAKTDEDDPSNDINYDTECGTEYSSSDDTSSEDGDNANDLNYDSDD